LLPRDGSMVMLTDIRGMVVASTAPHFVLHQLVTDPSQPQLVQASDYGRTGIERLVLTKIARLSQRQDGDDPGPMLVDLGGQRLVAGQATVRVGNFQVWYFGALDRWYAQRRDLILMTGLTAVAGLLLIGFADRSLAHLREVRRRETVLGVAYRELAEANQRLFDLATTDSLTGCMNRRHFMLRAEEEIARARRARHKLTLMVLDIDHFKQVNDRYGHPAGDAVIRSVARITGSCLRATDLLGRLGGEEFVMLLLDTGHDPAMAVADRIRARIAETPLAVEDAVIPVTVSIGLAELQEALDFDQVYALADGALYAAKQSGRNRVMSSRPPAVTLPSPSSA
jgi:diguanylate cyclase (GGDEF)-like protein